MWTILHDDQSCGCFWLPKGFPSSKVANWVLRETTSPQTQSLELTETAATIQMLIETITSLVVFTAIFVCVSWQVAVVE